MKTIDCFDDFMYQQFCDRFNGLDDDYADAFDEWMGDMDEAIRDRYVDLFGKFMHVQGYKEAMSDTDRILGRITKQ